VTIAFKREFFRINHVIKAHYKTLVFYQIPPLTLETICLLWRPCFSSLRERLAFSAPKEQPPRKLSGKRTAGDNSTLESGGRFRDKILNSSHPTDGVSRTFRSNLSGIHDRGGTVETGFVSGGNLWKKI